MRSEVAWEVRCPQFKIMQPELSQTLLEGCLPPPTMRPQLWEGPRIFLKGEGFLERLTRCFHLFLHRGRGAQSEGGYTRLPLTLRAGERFLILRFWPGGAREWISAHTENNGPNGKTPRSLESELDA